MAEMLKIISLATKYNDIESTGVFSDLSLTDYDVVIIDPNDFTHSFPVSDLDSNNKRYIKGQSAHVLLEKMNRRSNEIKVLLDKGRLIIVFLDALFNVRLISLGLGNKAFPINNYSWIPDESKRRFTQRLITGTGTSLKLTRKDHMFSPYFYAFQKELSFHAYLDMPVDDFDLGDVFIANSTDLAVGFTMRVSNGVIAFLPRFKATEENNNKFIGILLGIAKKHFGSETPTNPPDWTESIKIPGVQVLTKGVSDVEAKIQELYAKKQKIEKQINGLNDYKFLLYEQGHALERKVVDSLRLLGFKAETVSGENTDFDVIIESEEGRGIVEVEGKDNSSIHKNKIDQLLSAINQDAEQRDAFAKGILVGNHYRLKPVNERGEPFTETVIKLAKQYHYALITTVELFKASIYFLENPEDETIKKACRMAIFETDGEVVQFPLPKK